ncbi:CBS domain-containing protein [Streptomyces sp. BR123]|nr:CBS domain-containing protein [Streptomyces sp. BR123]
MVPFQRMITVPASITPRQLERTAADHGFSRLPVTGEDGAVLGYLHLKDALAAEHRDRPFPRTALHPITKVALDTPLDDTMTAMRNAGTHLAAVTGTQGSVLGFVTMEDVLEELFGAAADM